MYFVGRAAGLAVALEGALKLKEVSYLHAEAYPASELKHGPLALIDAETPTVVVLPRDDLYAKNLSTIAEIRARGGPVFVVTQPGAPLPDEVTTDGTGIKNTRARLSLLYGERHNFRLERMAGGQTVASLNFSGLRID